MVKNTIINLGIIRKIADALDELNERVVYVGGAVVSLYVNDKFIFNRNTYILN